MFRGQRVSVVMPCFNAERYVARAARSVPSYVDRVIVVDDGSDDDTVACVVRLADPRILVLRHNRNLGVGAAIATGYREALRDGSDLIAVMAGDGQMDPADLKSLLEPCAIGSVDYAKGNRFRSPEIWRAMPWSRLLGGFVLSALTKVTSGYHHIFDSQCGYTVIRAEAARAIKCRFYTRYGYPNDVLARLKEVDATVVDVPVRPVYEGQASGIRLWTVLYPISGVMLVSFFRRIWRQHFRTSLKTPLPRASKTILSQTVANRRS